MEPEEISAFLDERHTASMASMLPDGNIHLVAMWYGIIDDNVAVESKAKSQKIQNLRRDPRITIMVEAGDTYETLKGVQIVGRARIVEDRDTMIKIGISVYSRYYGTFTDAMLPHVDRLIHNRVGVIIEPIHIASWDHSKLR